MLCHGTEEGWRRLRSPLDRGRGRIAPSVGAAGAVGTCGLGERHAALRPSGGGGVLPGWTVRMALGLPDPHFSPVKKSRGPQTYRTLLDPSSTGVRGTGHPGGALYKSDFTARPRLRYKLRTAGGVHRQAIGEDTRPKATPGVNSWKGACPGPWGLHIGTVHTREHALYEQLG
ncbi:hypothetical protein NDU88_005750 [Pleurodeles waltl]|uniref:Uncharacterized protein n=1 Tax=Pleurodeles waltl TaxID=8319 RepID=A0AAV7TUV0_PLEWA|nr:hypothetical protein NDU88_005750 [Pleurodeles waltl]